MQGFLRVNKPIIFLAMIFLVASGPVYSKIKIIEPKNTNHLISGTDITIRWDGADDYNVNLYYSIDSGKVWNIIAREIKEDYYNWAVPVFKTGEMKLKIENKFVFPPKLIWDIQNAHNDEIRAVSISEDGKYILSGAYDGKVKIWDIEKREICDSLVLKKNVFDSKFFHNSDSVIIATDSAAVLWDRINNQVRFYQDGKIKRNASSIAAHPSENIFAISSYSGKSVPNDGSVGIYTMESGKLLKSFELSNKSNISTTIFSKGGDQIIFCGYNSEIAIYDWQNSSLKKVLKGHGNNGQSLLVWSIDISEDGLYICSGGTDQTVRFWNLYKAENFNTIAEHQHYVRSVKFHPADNVVLSASLDGYLRQWTFPEGEELFFALDHGGQIIDASYSIDGKYIVSGGRNKAVRLWDNYEIDIDTLSYIYSVRKPIRLIIPDIQATAGERITVPVLLENYSNMPLPEPGATIKFIIESPAMLLSFLDEKDVASYLDTLELTSEIFYRGDTIANFPAYALLYEPVKGEIRILDFELIGNDSYIAETVDGSIETDFDCQSVQYDIFSFQNSKLSINIKENPVKEMLNAEINLTDEGVCQISLYDLSGRLYKKLLNQKLSAKTHSFSWNINYMKTGAYFLNVVSGGNHINKLVFKTE